MPRPSVGKLLQVVAIGHGVIGAVQYRDTLAGMVRGGLVATVPERGDRAAAFWFMTAAPALWMGGRLLRSAEEHGDLAAQRATGATLLAVGALGAAAMPKGGFPALAGLGGVLLRRAWRG
ncbi:DUF6463 family protein [Streptomyces albus]|uniref:DUF6463 family protein n=1 Tax=Streptomyces TaxID=1883 RepID=UPI0004BD5455|nr:MULTISPECIES: DUF6463 family protein [Streptomyces]KPC93785.1 hypothetical protein ADL27_18560 [Streptomyces sp. NRRL F-6602]MDI6407554.1 DUF6463 family protein [Streptomyces albus]UVN57301.1 DUF6463 family protein [Streptomyces albus]GHJ19745.1 hypothetical protein TPA0909_13590 [Streptomyces albus]